MALLLSLSPVPARQASSGDQRIAHHLSLAVATLKTPRPLMRENLVRQAALPATVQHLLRTTSSTAGSTRPINTRKLSLAFSNPLLLPSPTVAREDGARAQPCCGIRRSLRPFRVPRASPLPTTDRAPRPSARPAALSQSLSQPIGAIGAKPWAIRAVEAAAPAEAESVPIEQCKHPCRSEWPRPPLYLSLSADWSVGAFQRH